MTHFAIGILFLIMGVILFYRYRRRLFNRRNSHGIETYTSYANKLKTRLGDLVLAMAALFLVLTGCALFISSESSSITLIGLLIGIVSVIYAYQR